MLLLLLSVPSALLLYGCYLWMVARRYRHLPGDMMSAFPIIGHLSVSLRHSFLTADECISIFSKLLKGTKGICATFFFFRPVVVVSDPLFAEKLITHAAFANKEPLIYETVPRFWRGAFSIADANKEWKLRRKELTNTLKKSNLDNYHRKFVEISQRLMDRLKKENGVINIHHHFLIASIEIIAQTHYDNDFCAQGHDLNRLYEIFKWGEEKIAKVLIFSPLDIISLWMPDRFLPKHCKAFNNLVMEHIEATLSKMGKPDLTQDQKDELFCETLIKRNLSMNKTPSELRQEVLDIFSVAIHTTSSITSATAVYLATLPEIQEKAWLEQREIFGDSDRVPTIEDIRKMDYLERVLKETLRFMTAPLTARRLKTEVNIDGTIIPNNTTVVLCSIIMRMDKRYFENPSTFDPDRYLKPIAYNHAHSFFGFGARNCPGGLYAMNVMKVIYSMLLRKFKLVSNKKFEDIKLTTTISMAMVDGYKVSLIRR